MNKSSKKPEEIPSTPKKPEIIPEEPAPPVQPEKKPEIEPERAPIVQPSPHEIPPSPEKSTIDRQTG